MVQLQGSRVPLRKRKQSEHSPCGSALQRSPVLLSLCAQPLPAEGIAGRWRAIAIIIMPLPLIMPSFSP